jgi:Icc-related predicted phosphoesterase
MKLLVLSDLHVEFAPFEPDIEATEAADVIVLAGDIHKGIQGMEWARKTFPSHEIIYVAGNHEFYGQHWDLLVVELRVAALMTGIHFLENSSITFGGVRFLGATLWTDFEFFGSTTRSKMMREAEYRMNDYQRIMASPLAVKLQGLAGDVVEKVVEKGETSMGYRRRGQPLSPTHTVLRHRESLAWLQAELEQENLGTFKKTVVVTHHYPSKRSTAARYTNDPLTAAFGSKLSLDLLTQTNLWIHGHTHDSCDYRLGDFKRSVRVVCNPRGYPMGWHRGDFENPNFKPGMLVEVDVGTNSWGAFA